MKAQSIQKLSILGLILMGASAVTAAILPSNKKDKSVYFPDLSVTGSNDNFFGSCTVTFIATFPCNNTVSDVFEQISYTSAWSFSLSNQTTILDYEW